jgi:hypothetical protein
MSLKMLASSSSRLSSCRGAQGELRHRGLLQGDGWLVWLCCLPHLQHHPVFVALLQQLRPALSQLLHLCGKHGSVSRVQTLSGCCVC